MKVIKSIKLRSTYIPIKKRNIRQGIGYKLYTILLNPFFQPERTYERKRKEKLYNIGVLTAASLKRVPSVVRLATAHEAANRVAAFSVLAARVCLTFVHVC